MKDRVFRDPVHGLVELKGEDRPIAELIDTLAMQRLRRIKQMGFAWLVYPGAEHSRFGHALGAFHIAQRVTRRLELDAGVARHVKVAALLHDIGHGPFSHAFEHVFSGHDHERWGARIATEDPELVAALETLEPGLPQTLQDVLGQGLQAALRAQAGAARSSTSIASTTCCATATTPAPATRPTTSTGSSTRSRSRRSATRRRRSLDLVVDYRRGMYAVEQYLFARSYMYAQVYHHKTVRAAEWMFIKTLERFAELARHGHEPAGLEIGARDGARRRPSRSTTTCASTTSR